MDRLSTALRSRLRGRTRLTLTIRRATACRPTVSTVTFLITSKKQKQSWNIDATFCCLVLLRLFLQSAQCSFFLLLLWKQQATIRVQRVGQHQSWTENELSRVAPQWHYKITKGDARGTRGGDVSYTRNKLVVLQRWILKCCAHSCWVLSLWSGKSAHMGGKMQGLTIEYTKTSIRTCRIKPRWTLLPEQTLFSHRMHLSCSTFYCSSTLLTFSVTSLLFWCIFPPFWPIY